ncbi:AAA family ATPase [Flammeovirga kamogawensis]|uniref:AAA family ATPase n=1 Tax=Flammeovirga kamogawensis TaxID=373891 RepID=A0ABX8H2Y0_9BACT|nr:AAA family ATPase [Flammeovirga kamogawensis]MBB6460467.1 putative Zn-ribbon and HTH transcriptional regulator/energy-coupling factor transporter ATP-binding protein EcfA2 [Flammeovirga kamogawensis]QWG10273.1 AAA family ATPase [Flammeovirga kamogawensis]TRX64721.1 hypothetical protein EO216_19480 [Flammeovirga kamogawensis]
MKNLWFFKSSGSNAVYGDGKDWYDDEIAQQYEFDNNVANSQQIKEGDSVIIFDKIKALGIAEVIKLDKWATTKKLYRCPHCKNTTFDKRKTIKPKYKCGKCKSEFEEPLSELKDITKFRVSYEDSFKRIEKQILITSIKAEDRYFPKNYNRNMSIQLLDPSLVTDYDLDVIKTRTSFDTKTNDMISNFNEDLSNSNLFFHNLLITRYISSLITKPFVLLSGLSGSGKTKLAQSFAMWICEDSSQYEIVAVGADWTNREPLLGYPNALNSKEYIKPDNGALDLITNANANSEKPYFLILDEMNLSHVERYFADFLSAMESKDEIKLHSSDDIKKVPKKITLPKNLFIIGTVNIDETTYMFSPKVLDRANVIEFRLTEDDIDNFFKLDDNIDLELLKSKGSNQVQNFLDLVNENYTIKDIVLKETLLKAFTELKKVGAEFGYRSANEITRLCGVINSINSSIDINGQIDIAIMQKLLPKLHGSRRKLIPVLNALGNLCLETELKEVNEFEDLLGKKIRFPISFEKLKRMYKNVVDNGFASYAEA